MPAHACSELAIGRAKLQRVVGLVRSKGQRAHRVVSCGLPCGHMYTMSFLSVLGPGMRTFRPCGLPPRLALHHPHSRQVHRGLHAVYVNPDNTENIREGIHPSPISATSEAFRPPCRRGPVAAHTCYSNACWVAVLAGDRIRTGIRTSYEAFRQTTNNLLQMLTAGLSQTWQLPI